MESSKTCPGKKIYSELNYETLRQNRMKDIDEFYQQVLRKYESTKRQHNQSYQTLSNNASDKEAELDKKTSRNSSADQKLEGNEVIKPQVIRLNNKLIDIARKIMDDNDKTSEGLIQQYQDLEVQEAELSKLMSNVDKLESEYDTQQNLARARDSQMDNSYNSGQSAYYWYMGLIIINFVLTLFLFVYILLLMQYL